MDIRQINYFVEVARCGSVTHAAAKLHISQPALSKSIANLEEELGKVLFIRKPGQIFITDDGRELLSSAQTLLGHFNDFQSKFCPAENVKDLKIGCSPLLSPVMYSERFSDFAGSADGVTYIEGSSGQLIHYILNQRLDMAVCIFCGTEYNYIDQIDTEKIYEGNFCAVTAGSETAQKMHCLVTSCELLNQIRDDEWHSVYYSDRMTEWVRKVMTHGYMALVPDFMTGYFPENVKIERQNYLYTMAFVTNRNRKNGRSLEVLKRYILEHVIRYMEKDES